MHHSPKPSFNSFPPGFEPQGRNRPICGSAWGLIADRLPRAQSPARPAAAPSAPPRRREAADQSSFSMSGFG